MTWVSFVLVVLLFFTPLVGFGPMIQQQPLTIDLFVITLDAPFGGALRLLLYSVVLWAVLSLVFGALEVVSDFTLLEGLKLRNGMLYSTRPWISNWIVTGLADFVAGSMLSKAILLWISKWIAERVAAGVAEGILPGLGTFVDKLLSYLWFDFDPIIIVFAVFALLASRAFALEREYRYGFDLRRNQQIRKSRLHLNKSR